MKKENKDFEKYGAIKVSLKEFMDKLCEIDKKIEPKIEKRCKNIFALLKKEKINNKELQEEIRLFIKGQELMEAYKKEKFYGHNFETIYEAFIHSSGMIFNKDSIFFK